MIVRRVGKTPGRYLPRLLPGLEAVRRAIPGELPDRDRFLDVVQLARYVDTLRSDVHDFLPMYFLPGFFGGAFFLRGLADDSVFATRCR